MDLLYFKKYYVLDHNQNIEPDHEWVTAPKFEALTEQLEHNPRTSTPKRGVPLFDENEKENLLDNKNSYISWKKHLNEPKNTFKVRGATFKSNDFIAGHLMLEKKGNEEILKPAVKNDIQQLNNNFINLILDGPNSQEFINTKEDHLCRYSKGEICYQYCHCNKFSNRNANLPIGYKVDPDGFIVQSRPRL